MYLGYAVVKESGSIPTLGWPYKAGDEFEMVGDSDLPDFPTPVVVTDQRGRAKWTVSIPPGYDFPLAPKQYAEICQQNKEVASHVEDLHAHLHRTHAAYLYNRVDPNFMDVHEAEEHGLLPGAKGHTTSKAQSGSIFGENSDGLIESGVCERSMTVVLETADAGLGKTLMMLWMAYGLAEKEGRSFFIDDSRWYENLGLGSTQSYTDWFRAYGKYTQYFQPPPVPACRPPPRHEMLPCPHSARHLVVSAATISHTFGGGFHNQFENPYKMEVFRQEPIYDFARTGYLVLFNLTTPDYEYVVQRSIDLRIRSFSPDPRADNSIVISMHVRHGDRHPYEFQYEDSYIPLTTYVEAAHSLVSSLSLDSEDSDPPRAQPILLVASDDPDVYSSDEFSAPSILRAQERISLASQKTSSEPRTPGTAASPRKFVEETVGWEGGFFSGMFWSLGRPSGVPTSASPIASLTAGEDSTMGEEVASTRVTLPPTEEALRLRELVGRAYLLDLTVLGSVSDGIVCTVSSMGCRLLAVMMGWEKAFGDGKAEKGAWRNVDGSFHWRTLDW